MTRDEKIAQLHDGRAGHSPAWASPPTTGGTRPSRRGAGRTWRRCSRKRSAWRRRSTPAFRRVATAISDEARAKYNQEHAAATGAVPGPHLLGAQHQHLPRPALGPRPGDLRRRPVPDGAHGRGVHRGLQGTTRVPEDRRHRQALRRPQRAGVRATRSTPCLSAHDLGETYLPQFEAAIGGRRGDVMAAYNRVNGQPCAASPWLLGEILRESWGFDGYVVSDCGAVGDIFRHHTAPHARGGGCGGAAGRHRPRLRRRLRRVAGGLAQRCGDGRRPEWALVRLSTARVRLGMFEPPAACSLVGPGGRDRGRAGAPALAREAAAESVVLLENRGRASTSASVRRLAVVGPTADDLQVLLGDYARDAGARRSPCWPGFGRRRVRGIAVRVARGATLAGTGHPLALALVPAEVVQVHGRRG